MLENKINFLWHISRTALAGQPYTRHDRCVYVKKALQEHYPDLVKGMTNKQIWLKIEDETAPFKVID